MRLGIVTFALASLLLGTAVQASAQGSGDLKIGYIFLDEDGNQSVNYPTFNDYEGVAFSLENFRYLFDNGIRLNANLKNMSLDNRNLNFKVDKPRLFGLSFNHNQYRRVYGFEGDEKTKRNRSNASLWVYPHRDIKLFAGGSYVGFTGSILQLFDAGNANPLGPFTNPTLYDYKQTSYNAGFRFSHNGRMLQAEYSAADFVDDSNTDRDQSRYCIKVNAITPIPRFDWIVASGGYRSFQTKYKTTDFKLSSNTGWAGALAKLPENFSLNYSFYFDRTSSDSDFVSTDNLSHAVYLSHLWPQLAGLTAGYQTDINDGYQDKIQANSIYFSGWLMPTSEFEFRGEVGLRMEEVKEGTRLTGDEDRNRFKFSAEYKKPDYGSMTLKFENKNRKNDLIKSEADFIRISGDCVLQRFKFAELAIGYSFSEGEYENIEQKFEFADHQVHGDITLHEYSHITLGAGGIYYRSKRDLDVERIGLHFTGSYRFLNSYRLEGNYNVHNFDDFLMSDQYYTANIVEVNLIRNLLF
ncbi:MAG: hypothetical protein CO189_00080 [candidate division Zixibacteria bacterium CG_4_9_14_3_um_filter_46_8]|nr:MAG: hypothetical protein CO189_00080 [candidate division Zixibacteria bacterium CG_4_9_14_3_um_filter_46_8]